MISRIFKNRQAMSSSSGGNPIGSFSYSAANNPTYNIDNLPEVSDPDKTFADVSKRQKQFHTSP